MNDNKNLEMLPSIESYNICTEISSQLISISRENLWVQDKFNLYKIIKSELEILSTPYKGTALNDLLENILTQFNKVEKETLTNLSTYKSLYSDPKQTRSRRLLLNKKLNKLFNFLFILLFCI